MENKQLEQALEKAIEFDVEWTISGVIKGIRPAAKACANITLEHMKGFAEWISKEMYFFSLQGKGWFNNNDFFSKPDSDDYTYFTTEELISLYFESLNKQG